MLTRQLESVAMMEIENVPPAGGVPESRPLELRVSQDGNVTGVQVTVPSPPVEANWKLKGVSTLAFGKTGGWMASGSPTRMLSVWVAVCCGGGVVSGASTTWTVKLD